MEQQQQQQLINNNIGGLVSGIQQFPPAYHQQQQQLLQQQQQQQLQLNQHQQLQNMINLKSNQMINDRLSNLCVTSDGSAGSVCAGDGDNMNLSPKEVELLQVIQVRNVRITELENVLRRKEVEMAELKSHLDKFQSVFPFSRGRKTGAQHGMQRQRAQGISAEPQSESSVLELLHVTFPKYDKEER